MGKGSAPRPYSVSQKQFDDNWDRIFGKNKQAENCGRCYNCLKGKVDEDGFPVVITRMIVCNICGNKRCPHATDHNLACTKSNKAGQPGSRY
jgi:hypothetical protein